MHTRILVIRMDTRILEWILGYKDTSMNTGIDTRIPGWILGY